MRELLIIVLISIVFVAKGQDIHFTQYNMSPHTLNPALAGNFDGSIRGGALYRDQWSSISPTNYQSILAFAEKKIPFGADYINGGILVSGDQAGPLSLATRMIQFSGSYHKKIGSQVLMGGIQFGVVNRGINQGTYPAQYDHQIGGFNSDLPTMESNLESSSSNFDMNIGVAWKLEKEDFQLTVGQAFYHLNHPDISLFEGYSWKLKPRFVTHARAEIPLTEFIGLRPSTVFKRHNKATEFLLGSMVRLGKKNNPLWFKAGSYYRNNIRGYRSTDLGENVDALSLNLGMHINKFDLGVAYDFNVSDLHEASNYRGGFELALIYTHGFKSQPDKITVPCYRY